MSKNLLFVFVNFGMVELLKDTPLGKYLIFIQITFYFKITKILLAQNHFITALKTKHLHTSSFRKLFNQEKVIEQNCQGMVKSW